MPNTPTTKNRLIEAAAPIFAEKGYRETTVAEICEAAAANIAAVNYHFGDKESLYSAVWNHLSAAAHERFPVPSDHQELGAEAWLRLFLRSRLERIFADGEAGLFPMLIHREMNEWTPRHDTLARTYLKPNRDRVCAAIRDFLDFPTEDYRLDVLTQNFMGVHISLNAGYQKHRDLPDVVRKIASYPKDDRLIQQIETFAIGGLKEVKESLRP